MLAPIYGSLRETLHVVFSDLPWRPLIGIEPSYILTADDKVDTEKIFRTRGILSDYGVQQNAAMCDPMKVCLFFATPDNDTR